MAAGNLGTTIVMVKGDSACFSVNPFYHNEDGTITQYEPHEGDTITFVLKKWESDIVPLLEIPIDIDEMTLVIDPTDTDRLPAGKIDGRYKYYIILERYDGWVDTFIHNANFILLEKG